MLTSFHLNVSFETGLDTIGLESQVATLYAQFQSQLGELLHPSKVPFPVELNGGHSRSDYDSDSDEDFDHPGINRDTVTDSDIATLTNHVEPGTDVEKFEESFRSYVVGFQLCTDATNKVLSLLDTSGTHVSLANAVKAAYPELSTYIDKASIGVNDLPEELQNDQDVNKVEIDTIFNLPYMVSNLADVIQILSCFDVIKVIYLFNNHKATLFDLAQYINAVAHNYDYYGLYDAPEGAEPMVAASDVYMALIATTHTLTATLREVNLVQDFQESFTDIDLSVIEYDSKPTLKSVK